MTSELGLRKIRIAADKSIIARSRTLTSKESWNKSGLKSTNHNLLPKRSARMIDRTEKPKIPSTFAKRYTTGSPNSVGVHCIFEFIRECMKIKKIRPKFHFLTKKRNKNDLHCVCVLLFTVSSPLEPFGSRFIDEEGEGDCSVARLSVNSCALVWIFGALCHGQMDPGTLPSCYSRWQNSFVFVPAAGWRQIVAVT